MYGFLITVMSYDEERVEDVAQMDISESADSGTDVRVNVADDFMPRAMLGLMAIGLHALGEHYAVHGGMSQDWNKALAALYLQMQENELLLALEIAHEKEMDNGI